jgi:hypothetical protein
LRLLSRHESLLLDISLLGYEGGIHHLCVLLLLLRKHVLLLLRL